MKIEYRLKKQNEKIGPFELEIECLDDLNKTIDQVFEILEGSGNPQDLERLCPYFGVIWPAARGLAEYLAELPSSQIQGQRILEMGCGLALPSLVAAKRRALVLATDFHPEVPRFLEKKQRTQRHFWIGLPRNQLGGLGSNGKVSMDYWKRYSLRTKISSVPGSGNESKSKTPRPSDSL